MLGVGYEIPSLPKELASGEEQLVVFKGVAHCLSSKLPWKAASPRVYKQHQLDLMGILKNNEWGHKMARGIETGVDLGGDGEEINMIKIQRQKFSKNNKNALKTQMNAYCD